MPRFAKYIEQYADLVLTFQFSTYHFYSNHKCKDITYLKVGHSHYLPRSTQFIIQ